MYYLSACQVGRRNNGLPPSEATGLDFVCFVVILRVLSANRVDLGIFFLFKIFQFYSAPPPPNPHHLTSQSSPGSAATWAEFSKFEQEWGDIQQAMVGWLYATYSNGGWDYTPERNNHRKLILALFFFQKFYLFTPPPLPQHTALTGLQYCPGSDALILRVIKLADRIGGYYAHTVTAVNLDPLPRIPKNNLSRLISVIS